MRCCRYLQNWLASQELVEQVCNLIVEMCPEWSASWSSSSGTKEKERWWVYGNSNAFMGCNTKFNKALAPVRRVCALAARSAVAVSTHGTHTVSLRNTAIRGEQCRTRRATADRAASAQTHWNQLQMAYPLSLRQRQFNLKTQNSWTRHLLYYQVIWSLPNVWKKMVKFQNICQHWNQLQMAYPLSLRQRQFNLKTQNSWTRHLQVMF